MVRSHVLFLFRYSGALASGRAATQPSLARLSSCLSVRSRLQARSYSSETGRIASKQPFQVSLKSGKTYFWCQCGESKKQPWCDGSHKGTSFSPIKFKVETEEPEAFLCGCKQSDSPPYCDGTHATPSVQSP